VTVVVHILSVVCALFGLAVVLHLQRSQRLRERHAIWWIVAGTLALVISVFPQLLVWFASLLGVEVPTNLVFFVSIALLFGVCLQLSSEITRGEEKTRVLAEKVAMLELRIDEAHGPSGAADTDDQSTTV
jgi:hypothetical protein